MSKTTADKIFYLALAALGIELFLSFGLFFQPSWSKGWPFASPQVAVAIVASLVVFAIQVTLLALTAPLWTDRYFQSLERAWNFAIWIGIGGTVVAAVVSLTVCFLIIGR